jgi:Domain of unknown function (DUF4397)
MILPTTKNCLLENNMFRLLKALPLTLGLAVVSFFATSCGSSSQSQIRVVNAIPDVPSNTPLDIDVNGTKVITALAFPNFQPSSGYTKAASGSVTITALDTGTTTQVLSSTGTLSGSTQYTVVLAGFVANAIAAVIRDTNTAPTSGNVEFRIINASPSGPASVDVYIVPPGTDIANVTPQISGLGSTSQASGYISLAAATYAVIVTANANKTPIVNQNYTLVSGQIRSLVLVDNQGGGNGMSTIPVELSDLN